MRARFAFVLLCLVIASCSSAAATGSSCASATMGVGGGALVATNGATLVVPAGALSASTDVEVCVLASVTPRRDQQSALLVVRPTGAALGAPASFTVPIMSATVSGARVEIGTSIDDEAPTVVTDLRAGSGTVSFDHDAFGYVRVFGTPSGSLDAGLVDSGPRDAARPDTGPPPLAPVVTGVDLEPADYSCLGTAMQPERGDPVSVDLHVVDWQDGTDRAGYMFRILPRSPLPDVEFDCSGLTDCQEISSDATGHVSVTFASGLAWIDVIQLDPGTPFVDDRHNPIRQVLLPIVVPASGGSVEVEALSQRTHMAVGGFTTHFGQISIGRVRDCNGDLVQRARIRLFDGSREISSPEMFAYGSTTGLPVGGGFRTGADGTFLVDNTMGIPDVRIEAWGQLELGGPEVMLSCEHRVVSVSAVFVGDMRPARADRESACSE